MRVKASVGQLDVLSAGFPIWVVAGPIRPTAQNDAPETLTRMSAGGPSFRAGLRPDTCHSVWEHSTSSTADDERPTRLADDATTQDVLDAVVGNRPDSPISVQQTGERLYVCFDHGIGDAHILMEILAGLSDGRSPVGFVEPVPRANTTDPLLVALVHQLRTHPSSLFRHMLSGIRPVAIATYQSFSLTRRTPTLRTSPSRVERYCAVFVSSKPEFHQGIRAIRDASGSSASVASILMLSIRHAMIAAGIPVMSEAEVLVDLRRFLPKDRFTLANFMMVTNVAAETSSFDEFDKELREKLASTRVLVKLLLSLTFAKVLMVVRRPRRRGWPIVTARDDGGITLTLSDLSKIPARSKARWMRDDDVEMAVALPPGSQSHVSVGIWLTPNGSVQLTATYFPSQVDGKRLRRALEEALNLPGSVNSAESGESRHARGSVVE